MNILGWLQNSHEWKFSGNGEYIHYNCKACNESVGNSGVYSVATNSISCFQPSCIFSMESEGWASGYVYLNFVEKWKYGDAVKKVKKYKATKSFRKRQPNPNARPWLPENIVPIDQGDFKLTKILDKYVQSRGFTRQELYEKYNLQYVPISNGNKGAGKSGDYFGRIIFPFYDSLGNLKYFQGRTFLPFEELRWKNPDVLDFGVGKTELLYNENRFHKINKYLSIHEGLFDVYETEKIGDIIGTSLGGTSISPYQINKILHSKAETIFIILDPYTAKSAFSIALALLSEGKKVIIINLTEGDCSEIGKDKVQDAIINNQIEVNFYNFLEVKKRIVKDPTTKKYIFAPKSKFISFYE